MPSDLIVSIFEISDIEDHSNADRLEIVTILGWKVVAQKGTHKKGDSVLYVPVDSIIPESLSDEWGVTKYLSKQRVKAVRLRGEVSYGLIIQNSWNKPVGYSMIEELGITKYAPFNPNNQVLTQSWKKSFVGRLKHYLNVLYYRIVRRKKFSPLENISDFHIYTKIANIKNYPNFFKPNDNVIISEKIHGTNSRTALIKSGKFGSRKFVVGSHNIRREIDSADIYSVPYYDSNVRELLEFLFISKKASSVILFSEIFGKSFNGKGVQDLTYGCTGIEFRSFDISVDGEYLSNTEFNYVCKEFKVPVVTELYRGEFSKSDYKEITRGNTTINNAKHIREGVVIRFDEDTYNINFHRSILKSISDDYYTRKDGTEYN